MSDAAEQHYDIQALFRGFGRKWPWALFVYSAFGDDPARNRAFLQTLPAALGCGDRPTSVANLDDNRDDPKFSSPFNVAFTYRGLSKLGIAPDILSSFPAEFIQGMRARADANHDYGRSAPDHWERPWRDGAVDLWIGIYASSEAARDRQRSGLTRHLKSYGMRVDGCDLPHQLTADGTQVWIKDRATQPNRDQAVEHFGFGDGISNPPIKGLARSRFLKSYPGGKIDASGNWQPLAAGEFLYGYLDEIGEVPAGPTPAAIGCNGSYLVLRKLSQDVDAFRAYLVAQAKRHGIEPDLLAAKLVGKTRDGLSLVAPDAEHRSDFRYAGDDQGMVCPLGSHVRRANPRDTLGFQTLLVDRHRILRRGVPYGDLVPRSRKMHEINPLDTRDRGHDPYPGQGLMFLALNVDIRRQFEFLQSQWINFGNDLHQGSDRDPIIGARDPRRPEHNRTVLLTDTDEGVAVCADIPSLVETRGGDYFFLPGLNAYAAIAEGQYR